MPAVWLPSSGAHLVLGTSFSRSSRSPAWFIPWSAPFEVFHRRYQISPYPLILFAQRSTWKEENCPASSSGNAQAMMILSVKGEHQQNRRFNYVDASLEELSGGNLAMVSIT